MDEGGKPAAVASAFMVKSRSSHMPSILFFTALHSGVL